MTETDNWSPGADFVDGKYISLDTWYVVDTSLFPSIGAVNPALTAMANAIRVGQHPFSRMS